jgi:hypothetical protein
MPNLRSSCETVINLYKIDWIKQWWFTLEQTKWWKTKLRKKLIKKNESTRINSTNLLSETRDHDNFIEKKIKKNQLKKPKLNWANLWNSWPRLWDRDYPKESKHENHEEKFSIIQILNDEIEKKNQSRKRIKIQNK